MNASAFARIRYDHTHTHTHRAIKLALDPMMRRRAVDTNGPLGSSGPASSSFIILLLTPERTPTPTPTVAKMNARVRCLFEYARYEHKFIVRSLAVGSSGIRFEARVFGVFGVCSATHWALPFVRPFGPVPVVPSHRRVRGTRAICEQICISRPEAQRDERKYCGFESRLAAVAVLCTYRHVTKR